MKKTLCLLSLFICLHNADAREVESPWNLSAGGTVMSSYFYAGYYYGGINVSPDISLTYNVSDYWSAYAEVSGYIDTDVKILPNEDNYNCGIVALGATYKDFSLYADLEVMDYNFKNTDSFFWGCGFDWKVSEEFPLNMSMYLVIYNSAPVEVWGEIKSDGKQCHSTIFTADMPFYDNKGFTLSADLAVVPWYSPFCGGYDKFSVCQLGILGEWIIGENEIPLDFNLGWNPAAGIPYGQISIGYFF